jgi:Major capsid protein N-terminus/Large eukaryotic DNA virus major capsid protein
MQLVARGAQDQLVNGNPSFTHFRSMYKRHTDFAMEHFRLTFKNTNTSMPSSGSTTFTAKVDRNAQLINDCYLSITLPPIYSPVVPIKQYVLRTSQINDSSDAIGYEFQWIPNIGYNMINYVSIQINGQEIVRHTGEWMKLYAALTFSANKKTIVDTMVGNLPQYNDPANSYGRINQYPHAISTENTYAEPSIQGVVLTIPLHFWFCENVGSALPLIAIQQSDVEIVVELNNIYSLFTVRDVDPSSPTFSKRIAPDPSNNLYFINNFLSPPSYSVWPCPSVPSNPVLSSWETNAYIECNYIFLSDAELIHIAKSDHSFIIKQLNVVSTFNQYGPSNDLELTMRNLCTRLVWVAQRSDRAAQNDVDNYTNWETQNQPPLNRADELYVTPWYSSGGALPTGTSQRDILLDSSIILDGKERFNYKQTEFFNQIQNYRFNAGRTTDIPGIYCYSFSLDHDTTQPSGQLNGSMFNHTVLRNSYVQPPIVSNSASLPTSVCVLKSTLFYPKPTIVNPNAMGANGKLLYSPNDLVTIVNKGAAQTYAYTYNVRAFVESYNFLRFLGGVANVVFSS